MEIVELREDTFPGVLYETLRVIKTGGVVIYPTDTVYGIGGDALNERVMRRIIKIKNRSEEKGMILLVRDHTAARKYAYVDLWTEALLEKIWPGPVSVILHKKETVPDFLTGGRPTVCLRVPDSRFAGELLKQMPNPKPSPCSFGLASHLSDSSWVMPNLRMHRSAGLGVSGHRCPSPAPGDAGR